MDQLMDHRLRTIREIVDYRSNEWLSSLTSRKAKIVRETPVKKRKYIPYWRRARNKIRGPNLWKSMIDDIYWYGTGPQLTDSKGAYKEHLDIMLEAKVIKDPQEEAPEKDKTEAKAPYAEGWTLDPRGKFVSFWSVVVLLLLFYTFTVMPYLISFVDVEILSTWFWIDSTVDLLFFCDIVIILNTALLDQGTTITNRKKIFMNYFKGMLVVDILAIFPFALITQGANTRSNVFVRFLRMARLSRIIRASKISKILKYFTSEDNMERLADFLNRYQGITRLATALFIVLILCHFTACMWHFSAKLEGLGPDTWVVRYGLIDESDGRKYLFALYWALTTLTTVGFGDISAGTSAERVICIVWMMFGVGFYSFAVGTITSVLTSMDDSNQILDEKISFLEFFSKDTGLDKDLEKRAKRSLVNNEITIVMGEIRKETLLQDLSRELRYRIAWDMHQGAINHIRFFRESNKTFVANIAPQLSMKKFSKAHFIYEKGQHSDEMYFIVKGRVNFVLEEENIIFNTMIEGSYFGEVELIRSKPRDFSTLADSKVQLLSLPHAVMMQIHDQYPKQYRVLKRNMKPRNRKNLQAKLEVVDLIDTTKIRKESKIETIGGEASAKFTNSFRKKKKKEEEVSPDFTRCMESPAPGPSSLADIEAQINTMEIIEKPEEESEEEYERPTDLGELENELNYVREVSSAVAIKYDKLVK